MKRKASKTKPSPAAVITFGISLPPELLERIDERCRREEVPNRSRYFRELVKRDLLANQKTT